MSAKTANPETETAPAAAPAAAGVIERWIYIGRRFSESDAKIYFAYLPTSATICRANELHYGKQIAGSVVGGLYDVTVFRAGDTVKVTAGKYAYEGKAGVDAKLHGEWSALDAEALTTKERISVEKSDTGSKLPSMTLEEIRAQLRKLPAPRRRALLAVVLDVLSR